MSRSSELDDLARHLEWADAALWQAVLDQLAEPLDARLGGWLHHIHTVQHAFLRLWRGAPVELPEPSQFADALALASWGREAHGGIRAFLGAADDATLDSKLDIPWSKHLEARLGHPVEAVTVRQSAVQVAMHSTHHRGQVAARLRELGGTPPLIDFIAWLWQGRPPARWPAGSEG